MICYKDTTFCPFWETCEKGKTCGRALTEKVKSDAWFWWGSEDAPICMFTEKPECYVSGLNMIKKESEE